MDKAFTRILLILSVKNAKSKIVLNVPRILKSATSVNQDYSTIDGQKNALILALNLSLVLMEPANGAREDIGEIPTRDCVNFVKVLA